MPLATLLVRAATNLGLPYQRQQTLSVKRLLGFGFEYNVQPSCVPRIASRSKEMAKKPKEADKNNTSDSNSNCGSNSGSHSSNIFKTLFGDVPDQLQSPASIFSDANPFQREPPQQKQIGLGFRSAEKVGRTTNGECGDSNIADVKKRKRSAEKPSLDMGTIDDADSDIRLEVKKSKRDKLKIARFGGIWEERIEEEIPDMKEPLMQVEGKDHDTGMMEKKEKKKRKRDQVDGEYEGRRYGVVHEGGERGLGRPVVGEKRKKVDDPEDMMMVASEGFDDEAKLLRTVFVGNLPLKIKKAALFKEFSQFGEIESVRIRSVPLSDTKKPRKGAIIRKKISDAVDSVHAYIVFQTEQAAHSSLAHNMALVGGNHVRIDRACPPRKKLKGENAPLYDDKRTVFVGNLPFDVKDEEIYQFFSGIKDLESSIEAVRVVRDSATSVGKGIAYVLFKTRGSAKLAVKTRGLKLRDRELRLYHPISNLTPAKRKNTSPGETQDSPTKKLAVDLRTSESSKKAEIKSSSSYQGLRASKSGASEQAGKKRKLESQTPESYRLNKKTRKLRQD